MNDLVVRMDRYLVGHYPEEYASWIVASSGMFCFSSEVGFDHVVEYRVDFTLGSDGFYYGEWSKGSNTLLILRDRHELLDMDFEFIYEIYSMLVGGQET